MKGSLVLLLINILWPSSIAASESENLWSWKCNSNQGLCTRVPYDSNNESLYSSIELCRLVCGNYGGLWPQPTGDTLITNKLFIFSLNSIELKYSATNEDVISYLKETFNLLKKSISNENLLSCPDTSNTVTVSVDVISNNLDLTWNTDEGYKLDIKTNGNENLVNIKSQTVFGARHGFETLSQLIEIYSKTTDKICYCIIEEAAMSDSPAFQHRGLLLDTARNFLNISSIKKQIDAMSYSKLNVLHWHITDSQSFPLEIPSLPNMTKYGAFSKDKIYTADNIKDLLSYAKLRGVRIIIEIDAPSHSGNGWQWGPSAGLGNLSVCVNKQPWRSYCIQPPCGQLNPINSNLYIILEKLYAHIMVLLPKGEIFHMGGDEVFIPCWNSTDEIINSLGNKSRTLEVFLDLWGDYQSKALASFDSVVGDSDTPIILWTSHLTDPSIIEKYLPQERYIIQTWVPKADTLPQDLVDLGYRIILSTKDAWYLDHGFWGNTVYHNWKVIYDNTIIDNPNVLGGEMCMWGEYVDDSSIQSRIWPRAAAGAERLWTNPKSSSSAAQNRLLRHRERLVSRGIDAEALITKWCYQNEGEC